jgi:hypothetical protein
MRLLGVKLVMMSDPAPETPATSPWRPVRVALFVLSAAAVALLLREASREPLMVLALTSFVGTLVVSRWLARRRVAKVMRSGDPERVLERWQGSLDRVPHAETVGPLMRATAFAAHGWLTRARSALRDAEHGPAWEAALEHRLFLDALLLTFEGDPERGLAQAERLQRLPLPADAPAMAERVRELRAAVAALARAFCHRASGADCQLLLSAGDNSPLVHWAMRYGAAICAVDDGEPRRARELLSDAPAWPEQSCFRRFHREIFAELSRRAESSLEESSREVGRSLRSSYPPPRASQPPASPDEL